MPSEKFNRYQVNWRKRLSNVLMFITIPFQNFGFGLAMRGWLYSKIIINCGSRFKLSSLINIYNPSRLNVGKDVYIGFCSYIGDGDIIIEDEVVIGPFCSIMGGNHLFRNQSVRFGGYEYKPVRIGKGTWIGANVVILAGVDIGCGCLIAAGSVVTKNIPDNVVAMGMPAKVIGPNDGNSGEYASNQEGIL